MLKKRRHGIIIKNYFLAAYFSGYSPLVSYIFLNSSGNTHTNKATYELDSAF